MHNKPPQASGPPINRIRDVMDHTNRYSFHGVKRLALDTGLSSASVSRIINGRINPHFSSVAKIARALSRELKIHIDPCDLVSENADFPHHFMCELVACSGCLPQIAIDAFGHLTATYQSIKPGQWVTSKFPHGLPERGLL